MNHFERKRLATDYEKDRRRYDLAKVFMLESFRLKVAKIAIVYSTDQRSWEKDANQAVAAADALLEALEKK